MQGTDKKTDQLKQEVDSLRQKVRLEAEELEDRLSFESAVDRVWSGVREKIESNEYKEFFSKFYGDVKRNPLALVLLGSGIALLFRSDQGASGMQYTSTRRAGRAASEKAEAWAEKAKEKVSEARDKVSHLAERVKQRQEDVSHAGNRAVERGREWVDRGKGFLDEYPAAVIGIGVVLGSIAASFAEPPSGKTGRY